MVTAHFHIKETLKEKKCGRFLSLICEINMPVACYFIEWTWRSVDINQFNMRRKNFLLQFAYIFDTIDKVYFVGVVERQTR